MKIVKLTGLGIGSVTAQVYKNTKGKMYFNISHGTKGKDLFVWKCGLRDGRFTPKSEGDTLELNDNNYIIRNVLDKNKQVMKDVNGNLLYNIDIDYMENHKNDLLVLWEIPNKNYKECRYTVTGDVDVIGEGKTGKIRGDKKFISPAPVLEIYGDCELVWSAVDKNNKGYKQIFKYDYAENKWSINPVEEYRLELGH